MFKRKTKIGSADGNVDAAANRQAGMVRYDARDVNIDKIVLETQPRRIKEQDLERLTDSIARVGLIHPVTVVASSDGTYLLICGRKRYLACKQLGWRTVPCIVKNGPQNDRYAVATRENTDRVPSDPVEEARDLQKAKAADPNLSEKELARKFGFTQSGVSERLSILKLDDDVLELVDNDSDRELKFTHLVLLAKLKNSNQDTSRDNEIRQLLNKTLHCHLTADQLGKYIQLIKTGDYDILPSNLQAHLLTNPSMLPQFAELYLRPAEVVGTEGEYSTKLRKLAEEFSKSELAALVIKAVENRWPYEKLHKRFIERIKQALSRNGMDTDDSEPRTRDLCDAMGALLDKIERRWPKLMAWADSSPTQLANLRRVARLLSKQLTSILDLPDSKSDVTNDHAETTSSAYCQEVRKGNQYD